MTAVILLAAASLFNFLPVMLYARVNDARVNRAGLSIRDKKPGFYSKHSQMIARVLWHVCIDGKQVKVFNPTALGDEKI